LDQLEATTVAVQQSDLVLLVLHAHDPARQQDVQFLAALRDWFRSRPDLKMPRVLGIMTHIDLLSPVMEWNPPYDWGSPQRPKEKSIHDAIAAAKEYLGPHTIDILPACVAEGKVYGVSEWVVPKAVETLDDARAVSLLRCLYAEADAGKIRKILRQLVAASKQLVG
jgi:predicted GTPase